MDYNRSSQPKLEFDVQRLRAGAILLGIAGVLGLAGAAVAGSALVSAFQQRVQQMEVPPTELARQHWSAVKHATQSGVGVWLNEAPGVQTPGNGARQPA